MPHSQTTAVIPSAMNLVVNSNRISIDAFGTLAN